MQFRKSIVLLSVIGCLFLCSSAYAAHKDTGGGGVKTLFCRKKQFLSTALAQRLTSAARFRPPGRLQPGADTSLRQRRRPLRPT